MILATSTAREGSPMTDYAAAGLSDDETSQLERANASGRTPVVFVHGLWLLAGSWARWVGHFEDAGYSAVTPSWPDDPPTVSAALADPTVFAGKSVGDVADHVEQFVRRLARKPAVIGHSFGGLLTQILAGRGLAAASVAIDPAPHRGVLPVPISSLRSAFPVLRNPLNHGRAVSLTFEQFRYAFANAVGESEAHRLYEEFSVAGPGAPVFQAAFANLNPRSATKVDTKNPARGPMLVIAGENDHTIPPAIARASFRRQRRNPGVTEFVEIAGRGHSLTIDSGWREVADTALAFVRRFV
jgi:non-heme chloroperoxidase